MNRKTGDFEHEDEAVCRSPSSSLQISPIVFHRDVLRIAAFVLMSGKTVREISEALDITLVKTYDLVNAMEKAGILVEIGKIRTAGHGRAMRYISTVKSGSIEVDNNHLIIRCNHKDGQTKVWDAPIVSSGED